MSHHKVHLRRWRKFKPINHRLCHSMEALRLALFPTAASDRYWVSRPRQRPAAPGRRLPVDNLVRVTAGRG